MKFTKSLALQKEIYNIIPDGCHTYAKGDEQFSENMFVYIKKEAGCYVWDIDGNKNIDATYEKIHEVLHSYKKVLADGVEKYLEDRSIQPVFRRYNNLN